MMPDEPNTATTPTPRTKKVLIWYSVTAPIADFWFNLSLAGLIAGALITFVSAIINSEMSKARDHLIDARISENEATAAKANEGFAQAHVELEKQRTATAQATARAEEAKLELEKYKSPRILSNTALIAISVQMQKFKGIEYDTAFGPIGDPEPDLLQQSIAKALDSAGWHQIAWATSDLQMTMSRKAQPTIGFAAVTNIIVDIHPEEAKRLWPVAQALAAALQAQGIAAEAQQGSGGRNTNKSAIHLMVGRKL